MAHTSQETTQSSGLRINARIARSVLLATCFMAFGSAAWSQSREYKHGYEEGFKAGRDSVLQGDHRHDRRDRRDDERHDGDNRDVRIRILDARYGRGRRVCDAAPAVQRFVNQRGEGVFQVGNDLCGDPAPSEPKTLEVTYQCGQQGPVRASADEGRELRIRCH